MFRQGVVTYASSVEVFVTRSNISNQENQNGVVKGSRMICTYQHSWSQSHTFLWGICTS